MKLVVTAAALALFPFAAFAHHDGTAHNESVTVEDVYARSSNPMAGAAFMKLTNTSDKACTLVGATSDVADKVELHTHKEVEGVMKMVKVEEGFEVPAGGQHALARGGDHVMFMGLKQPFENGQTVKVGLDFGDCGTVEVEAPVDNDRQPEHGDKGGMKMDQGTMDHSAMGHNG